MIVIEPADPDTVYVPYYDPATVYGDMALCGLSAVLFRLSSYIGAGVVAAGLAFGAGWAIGRWGNYWGGGCNWGNNNFYVNRSNRSTTSATTGSTTRRIARVSNTTTPTSPALRQQQSEGGRRRPDGPSWP